MTSVAVISKPPFSKKTLVKDSNCVLIQDPSAIWGGSDHLPRRNLLTYSEDFSNAAWSKTNCTPTANTTDVTDPLGGNAASKLVFTTGTKRVKSANQTFSTSPAMKMSVYMRGTAGSESVKLFDGWGTGSTVSLTTAWAFYEVSFTANSSSTAVYIDCLTDNATVYVWGAQLSLASTTDQSYQRITDWTTEQYAWAATKNVPWLRRNMCIYSETFGPTGWDITIELTVSAGAITATAANNVHSVAMATSSRLNSVNGQTYTASCKAKKGTHNYIQVVLPSAAFGTENWSTFDLNAGTAGSKGATTTASISGPDANGYYLLSASGPATATVAAGTFPVFALVPSSTATRGESWSTAGTESVYLKDPMINAGSLCAYQAIGASWAATYTSLALAAGYPISLYSDRAGTTATVGPDDPVGVLLDQSENLSGAVGGKRNLLTYSEDFSNAVHGMSAANYTVGVNNTEAPDGTTTADLITLQAVNGYHAATNSLTVDARTTQYTYSVHAKQGTNRYLLIRCGQATSYVSVVFDLANGDVTKSQTSNGTLISAQASSAANAFFRLSVTFIVGSATASVALVLVPTPTPSIDAYGLIGQFTPAGTETAWVWGAQLSLASTTDQSYQKVTDTWVNGLSQGYHSTAPSVAGSPTLRLDGNGKWYLDRDTTDDDLQITWPTNLTTTGVIYTATGDYTTKDSGLTLSGLTSYKYPQRPSGDYGRIVMKAESKYDAKIIKYLDQKRGRSYQLGPELVTTLDLTAAGWSTLGGVSARTTNTLTTTSAGGLTNTTIMSGNKMYLVQLGFSKTGSSSLSVRLYSGGPDVVLSASSTGVISGVGNTIASDEFYLRLSGADIVTVTSLSVREVIIQ